MMMYTTTTSVLMPLSRLTGVGNFCFNLLNLHFPRSYGSSLLKPYRSRSFFTHSSHNFLGRRFFLFPVVSSSITSRIISSIFTTATTLSRRTSVDTLPNRLTPHIILIIQRSTPRNLG